LGLAPTRAHVTITRRIYFCFAGLLLDVLALQSSPLGKIIPSSGTLPLGSFLAPTQRPALRPALFVDNPATLDQFCQDWLPRIDGAVVALDIEEERGQCYHPRVALIQLSVDGHDAILDPIVLGHRTLEPTVEQILLTSELIILHGGRNDVAGLRRDFDVGPRELGDTQIAARFIGERHFGLSALLDDHFGIRLDKEERRSDWSKRPLTESQLRYAQGDTTYLEELWHTLQKKAIERGWADAVEEECKALGEVPADQVTFDPLGWLKIKGMSTRDEDIRSRASRIWWWRDQIGQSTNTHPSQILPNWAVEQASIRGIDWIRTQSSLVQRLNLIDPTAIDQLQAVLKADLDLPIQRAREKRELTLPISPDAMRSRHDALSNWRQEASEKTGVEPGWLAPRSVLEEVARVQPDELEILAEEGDVRQWRLNRFADDWKRILARFR